MTQALLYSFYHIAVYLYLVCCYCLCNHVADLVHLLQSVVVHKADADDAVFDLQRRIDSHHECIGVHVPLLGTNLFSLHQLSVQLLAGLCGRVEGNGWCSCFELTGLGIPQDGQAGNGLQAGEGRRGQKLLLLRDAAVALVETGRSASDINGSIVVRRRGYCRVGATTSHPEQVAVGTVEGSEKKKRSNTCVYSLDDGSHTGDQLVLNAARLIDIHGALQAV